MRVKVEQIIKDSSVIKSIELHSEMKVILVDSNNPIESEHDFYPIIKIGDTQPFAAKILDHLWLDEKRCIEICSYDNGKNIYFGRAITPMTIKLSSKLEHINRIFRGVVVCVSEDINGLEFDDMSGKLLRDKIISYFNQKGYPVSVDYERIGLDAKQFAHIIESQLNLSYDLIFTVGGVGIGPRDFVNAVINKYIEYEIPGIIDLIRLKCGINNPISAINRSIAGINDKKLIFCLPGQIKAVREYFTEIEKVLLQTIYMIHGINNY